MATAASKGDMKALRAVSALALIAGVWIAAACGGENENGGGSATGGADTGAAPGGGTGGGSTETAGTGGSPGEGGATAGGGTGGDGGAPSSSGTAGSGGNAGEPSQGGSGGNAGEPSQGGSGGNVGEPSQGGSGPGLARLRSGSINAGSVALGGGRFWTVGASGLQRSMLGCAGYFARPLPRDGASVPLSLANSASRSPSGLGGQRRRFPGSSPRPQLLRDPRHELPPSGLGEKAQSLGQGRLDHAREVQIGRPRIVWGRVKRPARRAGKRACEEVAGEAAGGAAVRSTRLRAAHACRQEIGDEGLGAAEARHRPLPGRAARLDICTC
jgi:hypothetical protein